MAREILILVRIVQMLDQRSRRLGRSPAGCSMYARWWSTWRPFGVALARFRPSPVLEGANLMPRHDFERPVLLRRLTLSLASSAN